MLQLETNRFDISQTRLMERPARPLEDGEVRVALDCFALTANNITYAATGDKLSYWQFFPAPECWGLVPVWGFADVVESSCESVQVGERLFGFFPMAEETILRPERVNSRYIFDQREHRSHLHTFYNRYACVYKEQGYAQGHDGLRVLLYPLFATAYCLYDFLLLNRWFDAGQVVITSASSKTAIGLAKAIIRQKNPPKVVGLTSEAHKGFVLGLQAYDHVKSYDEVGDLRKESSTIVDMSGNHGLLSSLHAHLDTRLHHCIQVGFTHWKSEASKLSLSQNHLTRFFVPSYLEERLSEPESTFFLDSLDTFWREMALGADAWLHIERHKGLAEAERLYTLLSLGKAAPATGAVVSL